jgi:2-polyprenyl-3-methyl-5-hydroxy-6-metoxy-1,4-benzoquinol methylase
MSKEIQKKEKDHFQIDWNEHASYWDEDKNAIIYNNRVMDTLNDVLNIQDLRIMDFGCGTGLLTDRMSKKAREIVAIDASKKMLEVLKAKKYKKVSAIHGKLSIETIEKNPVLHRKFDLIVAASVCAFLPNYIEVLQRIKSLLKPDGIFVQWDWMHYGYG